MEIGKKIIRNTTFVFVAQIINSLLLFVVIAYAARILGPSDLGVYALLMTFAFLLPFFVDFGISPMGVRELAIDRKRSADLFNHILSMKMTIIVLIFILLLFIIPELNYPKKVKNLIYIIGISAIFASFTNSFRMLYMGYERMDVPSLFSIAFGFLSAVLTIAALYFGYGLKGIVLVHLFNSILAAAVFGSWVWLRLFPYRLEFKPSIWLDLLRQSLPFFAIAMMNRLGSHINILLLSQLPGPYPGTVAMGYYKPASSLGKVAISLPMSFRTAALPTIASFREDSTLVQNTIDKSTKYLLLFAFPLLFATTFFPREIISLLFGSAYIPAAPALTILGWTYALQAFNSPANATLQSTRDISRFVPWSVLITAVNIVFALILIPYLSFIGTAIALLLSRLVGVIARYYLLYSIWKIKFFDMKQSNKTTIFIVVAVIFFLFFHLLNVNPIAFLIAALVILPLSLFLFRILSRNEINTIIQSFKFKMFKSTV